jgi:hypothetical protein
VTRKQLLKGRQRIIENAVEVKSFKLNVPENIPDVFDLDDEAAGIG